MGLATAALMLTAVVAGTAVAGHGGSHGPSNGQDKHCPDHQEFPKDEDPGGVNALDVDGTTVWLHYSDDGTSVAFFADEAGTEELTVDSCIKASDQNSGHVIAHENSVTWTNDNGKPFQISYTVVYSIEDDTKECSDGIDNDGGGEIDFPDDPGCDDPEDDDETDSGCTPGTDSDGDGVDDCDD